MKEARNFILKNNIWNYFKKINYDYKEEFKIIEEDNKKIGYIVRSGELSHIDYYISKTKELKIKENLGIKNYHNEDNWEKNRNKAEKRAQSEDKFRKQLKNNFPTKIVLNLVSNIKMPNDSYITNKDNIDFPNIISYFQMNKEINKVLENKNNINIIKNNSENFHMNNMNISHQSLIEENNALKTEINSLKKIFN